MMHGARLRASETGEWTLHETKLYNAHGKSWIMGRNHKQQRAHLYINPPLHTLLHLLLHSFLFYFAENSVKNGRYVITLHIHYTLITFPESFTDLCLYQFVTTHVSALLFQWIGLWDIHILKWNSLHMHTRNGSTPVDLFKFDFLPVTGCLPL